MPGNVSIRIIDQDEAVIRRVIAGRFPGVRFVDRATDADSLNVLLSFRPPEDEALEAYDWVHALGAGVDHLCAAIAGPAHAPVITRTTGRMGQQISEYCLGYALADMQGMKVRGALQRQKDWDRDAAAPRYLFQSRVAILGTGSIGSAIAHAFAASGAYLTGYSRTGRARPGFEDVHLLSAFSDDPPPDILILALPATEETRNIVDAGILGALCDALLINVGRGSTLDHAALRAALDAGRVRHAILDVFESEPLPHDDWRWSDPRLTITPHVSGLTLPEDGAGRFCELLQTYLDTGGKPQSIDIERGY